MTWWVGVEEVYYTCSQLSFVDGVEILLLIFAFPLI